MCVRVCKRVYAYKYHMSINLNLWAVIFYCRMEHWTSMSRVQQVQSRLPKTTTTTTTTNNRKCIMKVWMRRKTANKIKWKQKVVKKSWKKLALYHYAGIQLQIYSTIMFERWENFAFSQRRRVYVHTYVCLKNHVNPQPGRRALQNIQQIEK